MLVISERHRPYSNRWALGDVEKQDYITAVECLAGKRSQTKGIYDGVRSCFDGFQGTHILFTGYVQIVASGDNIERIHVIWQLCR